MRSTPALRTLAAALLTSGSLAVAAAGTTAEAAPPTFVEGHGGSSGSGSPIWGTIVSRTDLNVRQAPTTHSAVVDVLRPGTEDRVQCEVKGQSVNGDPYWYWLSGAEGWVSAVFVDTGGRSVPNCADPSPQWKDGSWANWSPDWNDNNSGWNDPEWDTSWWSLSISASFSLSVSGS